MPKTKKRTPVLGTKAAKSKRPPIPNQQEQTIEERREDVFRRRIRGETRKEIATELGVSLGTVKNDLTIMRQRNAEYVTEYQQNEFVGQSMAVFEEIAQKAWDEYDKATNTTGKLKSLDLVRNLTKDQIRLLQEVGLLKVRDSGKDDASEAMKTFLDNLNKRARQRLISGAVQAALPTNLEEPTLDDIVTNPLDDSYEDDDYDDDIADFDDLDDEDFDDFDDFDDELEGWDEDEEE